jgi:hypothetical protein
MLSRVPLAGIFCRVGAANGCFCPSAKPSDFIYTIDIIMFYALARRLQ